MPDDVTRLLEAWREGQPGAADRVFSLMYDDLRAVARRQLARLQPGQTLAPTAVVHEAYMKFAQRSGPEAGNREHFLGIAARAMRNIVVDYIRRQRARKRDAPHVAPDAAATRAVDDSPIDILAMDEALKQLARLDARQAAVVELRFFGGLELKEIAAVLDTSERTIKRDWQKARVSSGGTWLATVAPRRPIRRIIQRRSWRTRPASSTPRCGVASAR